MNLVRMGHYYTPVPNGPGVCRTAIVVFHSDYDRSEDDKVNNPSRTWVNVVGWHSNGQPFTHTSVEVEPPQQSIIPSFHLSTDCPFGR